LLLTSLSMDDSSLALYYHLGEGIRPQRGRKCNRALKFSVF
jgi:hypothetical protein